MSFFEFPHTRTYDSDLGWIIKDTHSLDEAVEAIKQWIIDTQPTINDFKNLYNMLISGNLPYDLQKGIEEWLTENAGIIIPDIVGAVFFGLDNGYFVAYIPDSWDEIIFGTSGLDDFPANVDFGHLTLSY